MDLLLNLLIYLPLRPHSLIPSFGPPIWCFSFSFSAQIAKFSAAPTNSRFRRPIRRPRTYRRNFRCQIRSRRISRRNFRCQVRRRRISRRNRNCYTVLSITFAYGLRFCCSLARFEATEELYDINKESMLSSSTKFVSKHESTSTKGEDRRMKV